MPFTPNDANINRKGRPKGTNSFSVKIREDITNFCDENLMLFLNDIKAMKPGYAKAQSFLTLLNYVIPKLTESNSMPDMESLTDNQLDTLLNKYYND